MILFISSGWRCFLAKCWWYPHLESRYISFSFYFNYTETEELREDIKYSHWMKVKLKLSMHSVRLFLNFKDSTFFCAQLLCYNYWAQTHFLLLLSGSYGYDRNRWFQTEMIINFRNELPSSCFGCLHKKLNL